MKGITKKISPPFWCISVLLTLLTPCVESFVPPQHDLLRSGIHTTKNSIATTSLRFSPSTHHEDDTKQYEEVKGVVTLVASSLILGFGILTGSLVFPEVAYADEIGRDIDAPTLYTGETSMICIKRGPLGACTKTEKRTKENDNDQADKYFNDPLPAFQEKYQASADNPNANNEEDGNSLIKKLRLQSEENKEKNEKLVKQKTLVNNLGASFGPFDKQVVILNADGENFTLLESPQAMRLKNEGYIKGKKFVTQPTQKAIDDALEASQNSIGAKVGGAIKGIIGLE